MLSIKRICDPQICVLCACTVWWIGVYGKMYYKIRRIFFSSSNNVIHTLNFTHAVQIMMIMMMMIVHFSSLWFACWHNKQAQWQRQHNNIRRTHRHKQKTKKICNKQSHLMNNSINNLKIVEENICEMIIFLNILIVGDRGVTVVKVLCYKSEGRWFDPSWCHWKFS